MKYFSDRPFNDPEVAARKLLDLVRNSEVHKAAVCATRAALDRHSEMDHELPIEKCRSSITAWGEAIVETDDPRWIDGLRAR